MNKNDRLWRAFRMREACGAIPIKIVGMWFVLVAANWPIMIEFEF